MSNHAQSQSRVPGGVTLGGAFATERRAESPVTLREEEPHVTTYTTRGDAIERAIVIPLRESGENIDGYDIDAIADEVIVDVDDGFQSVEPDQFWASVQRHVREEPGERATERRDALRELRERERPMGESVAEVVEWTAGHRLLDTIDPIAHAGPTDFDYEVTRTRLEPKSLSEARKALRGSRDPGRRVNLTRVDVPDGQELEVRGHDDDPMIITVNSKHAPVPLRVTSGTAIIIEEGRARALRAPVATRVTVAPGAAALVYTGRRASVEVNVEGDGAAHVVTETQTKGTCTQQDPSGSLEVTGAHASVEVTRP